ncbi:OsmC family peroxiredoxin [Rathayibacter sp. YIM 133350]|uniref:OsmC family peroxiredoxin n=1 Tax=Rathayibacter sp. YIM 133350 TaxID=3131992 RepID=UPI00307EB5DC
MEITSEATTVWNGELITGSGSVSLDSSQTASFPLTWKARAEGAVGTTNPEELLAAAHASCFSMAFSNELTKAGHSPTSIQTTAAVTFEAGRGVVGSHLLVNADVPGISDEDFHRIAEDAKTNCPISKALAGIPITLEADRA